VGGAGDGARDDDLPAGFTHLAFFDEIENDSKPRLTRGKRAQSTNLLAYIFKKAPRTVHLHCGTDHNQLKSAK
jgi:hypothetical protein